MAELKTKPTTASVTDFINAVDDDQIRKDSKAIAAIMAKITKSKPRAACPASTSGGFRTCTCRR